jgi:hypothetical protein
LLPLKLEEYGKSAAETLINCFPASKTNKGKRHENRIYPEDQPERKWEEFVCIQDVVAEREIVRRLAKYNQKAKN